MDYQKWIDCDWAGKDDFDVFEKEMVVDLEAQLAEQGLKILRRLPNQFCFGAVITTEDESKFLHLVLPDVRDSDKWFEAITLRRMSSPRDWKGEHIHVCSWNEVGAKALLYMDDKYDNEVL